MVKYFLETQQGLSRHVIGMKAEAFRRNILVLDA
jgi:hypothetical protein